MFLASDKLPDAFAASKHGQEKFEKVPLTIAERNDTLYQDQLSRLSEPNDLIHSFSRQIVSFSTFLVSIGTHRIAALGFIEHIGF